MKFFTPEIHEDEDDGSAFEKARDAYREHLSSISERLPKSTLELANLPGLHSSLPVRAQVRRASRLICLRLRGGDLQMGYYDVDITCSNAEISEKDLDSMQLVFNGLVSHRVFDCQLGYHEVDVLPNDRILYRLMFEICWPERYDGAQWASFGIESSHLSWKRTPRRTRRIRPTTSRFILT